MKRILFFALMLLTTACHAQRWVKSYSTISEALASPTLNDVYTNIFILGYSSANDGGGGQFWVDKGSSTTTNRGTVFAFTGGRLKRVIEDSTVNVRMFGAKGDGTTDDTASFQAVADWYDPVSGRAGTVRIPTGKYVINSVRLTHGGQKWIGEGAPERGNDVEGKSGVVLVHKVPATGDMFEFSKPGQGISGAPSYWMENIVAIGHPDLNLKNPVAITSVDATNRHLFYVSPSWSGFKLAGGSGYTSATVTIAGDGTGATGTVTVSGGKALKVTVTNPGSNYTFATATISGDGSGATARVELRNGEVDRIRIDGFADPKGGDPFYGFVHFWSNTTNFLGSGLLQSMDFSTGLCTLRTNSDLYATVYGEDVLRPGFLVTFPEREECYTAGGFIGYQNLTSREGYAFISIWDNQSAVIKHCKAIRFFTGIVNYGGDTTTISDFETYGTRWSSLQTEPWGQGTDFNVDTILSNGPYYADDGYVDTNVYTNTAWRSQTIGYGFCGAQSKHDHIVAGPSVYGVYAYGANSTVIDDLLLEGPAGPPIRVVNGNSVFSRQRPLIITNLRLNAPQGAVLIPNNRISTPVIYVGGTASRVNVGLLTVSPFFTVGGSPAWVWGNLYEFASGSVDSGVSVARIEDPDKMITQNHDPSSTYLAQSVMPTTPTFRGGQVGQPLAIFDRPSTGERVGVGLSAGLRLIYPSGSDGSGLVLSTTVSNGVISIAVTSGGTGYIYPPEITITGDGVGARAFATVSGGVVQLVTVYEQGINYTTATATASNVNVLDDVGQTFARTATTSTYTSGANGGTAAPITGVIEGEPGLGTDIKGGDFQVRSGRSTGAANSGLLQFATTTPSASSATGQSYAIRLQIGGGGQLLYTPMASDPTINAIAGAMYYNSTEAAFRVNNAAGWKNVMTGKRLSGSATLDFPSTSAQQSSDLTVTVTGALDGDRVILGVPNFSVLPNSCYTAWVSATDTVTIRFNNYGSISRDPGAATFKVWVDQ